MGKGADGGDTRRARRHTGSIAAAAGATALATAVAVAGWQRRRRERVITPEDSLAGPPVDLRVAPRPTPPSAPGPATAPRVGPATEPAASFVPTITVGDESRRTAVAPPPPGGVDRHPGGPDVMREADPDPTSGPVPTAASPAPRLGTPTGRRVPRSAAVLVGFALVLVLGIGALVLVGDDDGGVEAADPRPAGQTARPVSSTTTVTAPITATDAFAVASQRLNEAGSFSYTGTADATDVGVARPMLWLAVATTVEGEVVTPTGRLREVSVADDGSATETVAAGAEVWGRRAPSVEGLEDVPLEALPGLSGGAPAGRGAALLPSWLAAAVAPSELGPDAQGRRTFQATIPAATMGVVERDREPVDAVVTLTLDADDNPARVEIVSSPDGPPFRLVFEIGGVGEPVVVETPADAAVPAG